MSDASGVALPACPATHEDWSRPFSPKRELCARTDPHPADYGADTEGHVWRPASEQEWPLAVERLLEMWGAGR